jgi:NCAIR mutase (PurE)-related protein
MEGALPSLVASLVDIPIIAFPTSTSFCFWKKGISALMAMLQSCSLGLAVVNIDNGVGAGSIASLIARKIRK